MKNIYLPTSSRTSYVLIHARAHVPFRVDFYIYILLQISHFNFGRACRCNVNVNSLTCSLKLLCFKRFMPEDLQENVVPEVAVVAKGADVVPDPQGVVPGAETSVMAAAAVIHDRAHVATEPRPADDPIALLKVAAAMHEFSGGERDDDIPTITAGVDPTTFTAEQKQRLFEMFHERHAAAYVAVNEVLKTHDVAFFLPRLVVLLNDPSVDAQCKAEAGIVVCTFFEETSAENPVFTQEIILTLLDVLCSSEPYINLGDLAAALCGILEDLPDGPLKLAVREKLSTIKDRLNTGRIDKFFKEQLFRVVGLKA